MNPKKSKNNKSLEDLILHMEKSERLTGEEIQKQQFEYLASPGHRQT